MRVAGLPPWKALRRPPVAELPPKARKRIARAAARPPAINANITEFLAAGGQVKRLPPRRASGSKAHPNRRPRGR